MANVIVEGRSSKSRVLDDHDLARAAGRFLLWGGMVYLIAVLVDLGVLWIGQNQDSVNFEFVALTRTAEAFPRFILATSLIYAGLWIMRSESLGTFRLLSAWVLLLGVAALILVGLTVLNYLTLASTVTPEAKALFRSAVVKTGGLGALYVLFLIPLGILGFRTRRRFG